MILKTSNIYNLIGQGIFKQDQEIYFGDLAKDKMLLYQGSAVRVKNIGDGKYQLDVKWDSQNLMNIVSESGAPIILNISNHRAELDAIMFTNKAIFVIEVKNPGKDVYIDDHGNYCRVGHTMVFDKNIGEKMNDKIFMLREAMRSSGILEQNIINTVVFTNNAIRVDNNYPYINTCFLGDLPHIIEGYCGENIYSDEDIDKMVESISRAECKESYPLPIDMNQFKTDFATVMVMLEEASAEIAERIENSLDNEMTEATSISMVVEPTPETTNHGVDFNYKTVREVAAVGVTLAFTGFLATCICKAIKK